jgi:hypothetical protein
MVPARLIYCEGIEQYVLSVSFLEGKASSVEFKLTSQFDNLEA